ncbi:MAG TPA: ferritin-like domain-containing protein [Bacteroidales bacterium]|nr:ferritin [Bacteroidales bacterium]HOU96691.1 ferritin-like domain-containing protein [Bacteroidales bacterium]HQG37086.1 ferritin-like domain-containing protein [Bacteroidales bacterium]HQG52431.1 ferritin-like domain-containing protein [Bacteroidales bacterium]HQJ20070.1 ferritin-like domain-containing protein [Bacteroidales bacterium]
MAEIGKSIVKMDVGKLINLLNKALADEWLAYYQYWIGAKVVKGPMKDAVISELNLHATEELGHAQLLATRIIQLGGTPLLTPNDWFKMTNCGYDAPTDPYVEKVLEQNIKGEQCAIKAYSSLLDVTRESDPVTYEIIVQILSDEVEHEEDLAALKEDLELMLAKRK